MGDLVSLSAAREEREPHMTGMAKCLTCQHTYVAVAPIGTAGDMECPACGTMKSHFVYTVRRGEKVFVCNCGCDLFRISPEHGPYCINCAVPAQGWF